MDIHHYFLTFYCIFFHYIKIIKYETYWKSMIYKMVKNSWRYEHPFKLLPGVVLKIIITSSLHCVFVAVVAKISILGYFPQKPIFWYFGILGIFGYFGRSSHFPHFPQFWLFSPFLHFCLFLLKLSFLLFWHFPNFGYFWLLGKNEENRITATAGKNSENSVFYVFVKLGDLGKTVKRWKNGKNSDFLTIV